MTGTAVSVVDGADAVEVETREERAARRVQQLRRAVSGVLDILAEIYRDDDWRHLVDTEGQGYRTFAAFIQDQLGGSASGARRYQQGIVDLIVPLQEIVGFEAAIPVTSTDIARLGQAGARTVVAAAPAAVEGQDDRVGAVRSLIDAVISGAVPMMAADDECDVIDGEVGDLVPATVPVDGGDCGADDGDEPDDGGDDHRGDEDGAQIDSDGSGVAMDAREFRGALTALLATDPVTLAAGVKADGKLSADCVAGAQLLGRISQLLR